MRPYPLGIGDHSQRKERRDTALDKEEELQKLDLLFHHTKERSALSRAYRYR